LGMGLLVLNHKQNDRLESSSNSTPTTAPAERPLEGRLLQQHLRLAEAEGPAEQFDALAGMAADLRTESFRAARRGADREIAYLVWLHACIVEEGLIPCAGGLPAEEKALL